MEKVIFVVGTFSNGGAQRTVSNLSLNLSNKIEKNIIIFGKEAKVDYEYEGNLIYLDKEISKGVIKKIKNFITRGYKINKLKKENPGVPVISFLEYPNLLNLLTIRNENTFISVRNFMSTKHAKGFKAFIWNLTIKYFYKRAQKIIVVSKEIKKDLIKNYKLKEEKIEVIYNFYPVEKIKKQSTEEIEDSMKKIFDKPVISTVGRLTKQKGHFHLIKAFAQVKTSIPEAQLVILGEGELKENLTSLARNLNVLESVHFLGFEKNPFKYISKSQVFAMTSLYEGFPNALSEAMACGVPVMSTDCLSGPREILAPNEIDGEINYEINKNRYGVLVPKVSEVENLSVDNEKIMANILIKVLKEKEMREFFSEASLSRIEDFNVSNIIKQWKELTTIG